MTVTDQIKILDRKIMQNKVQYDLDRKAAKISALSSNNLGASMNIWLVKIWVLSQALLNKLNFSILYWVKLLLRGWMKMIKKKAFKKAEK